MLLTTLKALEKWRHDTEPCKTVFLSVWRSSSK